MRLSSDTLNILVGAGVVLIISAYMVYGYLSDRPGQVDGGYHLTAKFRSIDGVGQGSDVMLAGIPIGKVTGSSFDPQSNTAILNMTIDEMIELPIDSVAMIVSEGIFGSKFVKVSPGGEFDLLEPGDEFEYVQDSVIFEELLQKVILAAEARRRAALDAKASQAN